MSIAYRSDEVLVWEGDSIELMRSLPDACMDSVVTDPPYALEFMGKGWDKFTPLEFEAWCAIWAAECFRLLKPGGHLLAFGGTRTFHRLAAGVEDVGFEIRDSIAWLYGSGFPKSHNLKDDWAGWGTALKPAFEPIVVARKPLIGTVATNVLAHGTGALNIDASRIVASDPAAYAAKGASVVGLDSNLTGDAYGEWSGQRTDSTSQLGRWPANVILDESQAAALDEQSGIQKDGVAVQRNGGGQAIFGGINGSLNTRGARADAGFGGSGGASRFFYVAKAPAKERPKVEGSNAHPTVKPLALMQWLVKLVTPPGGQVLDPFAGSGTTVEACLREGLRCMAMERETDYVPLILHRIDRHLKAAP